MGGEGGGFKTFNSGGGRGLKRQRGYRKKHVIYLE